LIADTWNGAAQIITHLLKLYDAQRNLVIVVNATPSDEAGLAEDLSNLGVRRPGLVQVGYEMNAKQRLVSVWPRGVYDQRAGAESYCFLAASSFTSLAG